MTFGSRIGPWPSLRRTTGAVALALSAPLVLAVLPDFINPAYSEPGWGEGLKLSADLVGLVTLTPLHPLAGIDWIT